MDELSINCLFLDLKTAFDTINHITVKKIPHLWVERSNFCYFEAIFDKPTAMKEVFDSTLVYVQTLPAKD